MSKDFENNNGNKEPNSFGLPEDYFKSSANSIFNKIEWLEEHKAYPHLANLKKESGFVVPETYFNASETELELMPFPNLRNVKKESGFAVPETYFEETEVRELAKVISENENELTGFDTLKAIGKENPFSVKENYFELSQEKLAAAILQPEAKVIRLNRGGSAKLWYSAAAAVFAITLGIWIYNQYFKPVVTGDCGTLACVDKKDLLKAKTLENIDSEELYELVDTKKLEENLETKTKENKKTNDTASKEIDPDDVMDEL
ncbi:MAG: hypothetical protein K0S12_250 [Bacteroidetes bacterium]|jgi:hypothetical protein|nr:hypothetical protein [Bacteroidota bacterium]